MDVKRITKKLRTFESKSYHKAIWQIISSLVPIILLLALTFNIFYHHSNWWFLLTVPVVAAFMVRLFMIYHDCGHQNFTKKRRLNNAIGHIIGFIFFAPFPVWNHIHNRHHANSGNLDKRDILDVILLTKNEYSDLNLILKVLYRFYRSFTGRFLISNQLTFLVAFRIPALLFSKNGAIAIMIYNVLYILLFWRLSYFVNLWDVFFVLFPIYYLVFGIGSFLFYLQHTFEDAYWERSENWRFHDVGFNGSSFWDVPKVLHWFTGNIGYHNIHHLNLSIPNYNLPAAYNWLIQENIPIKRVGFIESLTLTKYNLWDEEEKIMVDF